MNRKTMFSFIATLLMLAPSAAFAVAEIDTLTALQHQIAALQQQLLILQGRQSGGGGGSDSSLPTEKPKPIFERPQQYIRPGDQPEDEDTTTPITFDRNLYLGLRNDSDVSNLQEFLTDQGFYNQTISGNFFILTRNAVKKFQQAHGIKPSGYFGSLTRTVANKILAGEEVSPVTPPPFPVSTGHLKIDPAYAVLNIGERIAVKAYYQPPMPACPKEKACIQMMPPLQEVPASFVSDNPKIANIETGIATCAPPPPGVESKCSLPFNTVRGVSEGSAVITATYSDYRTVHVARMKVSVDDGTVSQNLPPVISSGPLTLTAPNGGQQWQLNSLHTITWAPYDPNSGVNPAKEVTAYLETMAHGQYVTVGKIIESGKASIHWIGEIDTYGKYPLSPEDYYIRIVNNRTGESDRSDGSFRLVSQGTLKADIKLNRSDGPIAIPSGSGAYSVSWSSNADSCNISNGSLPNDHPAYYWPNLPSAGDKGIEVRPNTTGSVQHILLGCVWRGTVEGTATDYIELLSNQPVVSIIAPNGGENLNWGQAQSITWTNTGEITKISLALYKNDKWFSWITPSYAVSAGKNFYTWTPSQTISQSDIGSDVFKIYMIGYKTSGGTVEDKSDMPFSIMAVGTGGTFSITDVSGVQSAYVPGQQIKLTVKGIEPDGSPATSGEGFNVQTYIYDAARTKTYAGVNGTYNASTGYWDVLLDAPSASNVSYDLEVFLYCSNDSAVCASRYGRAAQVAKLFKFTLLSSVSTDLRITSITRETFHPYGFNMTICTDGSQSINDLKKINPNLKSFPVDYVVYDLHGNRYRGDASSSGSTEDMKNGQCQTLGWTIQQSEQAYYDQTKKVELLLDPANLVAETNESNNSLVFTEPQTQSKMQILSPNGGETLVKGQSATISWTGGYPKVLDSNSVALQLQRPDGSQVGWISFGNQPSGMFSWDPAKVMSAKGYPYNVDVPDGQYKITAIDYNSTNWQGPGINNTDQSDGTFTIATLIPVVHPQ